MDTIALETLNDWLVRRHSPEWGLPYWHGRLTGVVCAPDLVPPSEWMPEILGTDRDGAPDLTEEDMERVTGLVMTLYNETCDQALGTRFKPRLSSAPDAVRKNVPLLRKLFMKSRGPDGPE